MDNCVWENKNKYVMAFCSYLVEVGIFTEVHVYITVNYYIILTDVLLYALWFKIELGFLMVGHTHEDIDQTFSCVSRYLKKHDALTIPGMTTNFFSLWFIYDVN